MEEETIKRIKESPDWMEYSYFIRDEIEKLDRVSTVSTERPPKQIAIEVVGRKRAMKTLVSILDLIMEYKENPPKKKMKSEFYVYRAYYVSNKYIMAPRKTKKELDAQEHDILKKRAEALAAKEKAAREEAYEKEKNAGDGIHVYSRHGNYVRTYTPDMSDKKDTPNPKTYIEKAEGYAKKIRGSTR